MTEGEIPHSNHTFRRFETMSPETELSLITDARRYVRAMKLGISPDGKMLRKSKESLQELMTIHRGLAVKVAKKNLDRGVPLPDLIQEGLLGIIEAVDSFDNSRGAKFSTHATWRIRGFVALAVADHGRNVRYPKHIVEQLDRLRKVRNSLYQELRVEPTLGDLVAAYAEEGVPADTVKDLCQLSQSEKSLNDPLPDSDEEFGEQLPDHRYANVEDVLEKETMRLQTAQLIDEALLALETLPELEREILRHQMGLVDGKVYKLKEIERIFGITKAQLRHYSDKGLLTLSKQLGPAYASIFSSEMFE